MTAKPMERTVTSNGLHKQFYGGLHQTQPEPFRAEGLGEWFEKTSTKASSNYGIDKDGRVGMYVEEKNRS